MDLSRRQATSAGLHGGGSSRFYLFLAPESLFCGSFPQGPPETEALRVYRATSRSFCLKASSSSELAVFIVCLS